VSASLSPIGPDPLPPSPRLRRMPRLASPYRRRPSRFPIALQLDSNEGAPLLELGLDHVLDLDPHLNLDVEGLARYPDIEPLRRRLAARCGRDRREVLITAGADEALDRVCRAWLSAGRRALRPAPGFEMVARYVALAGGELDEVPWTSGCFPEDALLDAATVDTDVVFLTTPNNPTGLSIDGATLRRVALALPETLIVVDAAYAELGDEIALDTLLDCSNVVIVRTFSKGLGLAGLRLGYALAHPTVVDVLAAAGGPYPVSAPSVALACRALEAIDRDADLVARRRQSNAARRGDLTAALDEVGLDPLPSQANFVLARAQSPSRATFLREALASRGVAVRTFESDPLIADTLRVGVPARAEDGPRLSAALRLCAAPEALLFDMDGVLIDVRDSYRRAIVETAATFGVVLSTRDVARMKAAGAANDDWSLTWRLLQQKGRADVSLQDVTEVFERLYQGDGSVEGLRARESLLLSRSFLERLAARWPLAVVTGRPRRDAEDALERWQIAPLFGAVVTRDDAPLKPDPAPVRRAMRLLGVERAWMLGDTVDDLWAAQRADVLALGFSCDADERSALLAHGAAAVFGAGPELLEVLPC
jgi:histidinol-phosphate aminotransferase